MIKKDSKTFKSDRLSFRLLNSEIGNDLEKNVNQQGANIGFRLLNSEIGNDHFL